MQRERQTRLATAGFGCKSALGAVPNTKTSSRSSDFQHTWKAAGKLPCWLGAGAGLRKGIQLWDSPLPACSRTQKHRPNCCHIPAQLRRGHGGSALGMCRELIPCSPCLSHPFSIITTKNQTRFNTRQTGKKDTSPVPGGKMAIFRDSHPTQQISGKRSGHGSWRERRWSSAKPCPALPSQQHPALPQNPLGCMENTAQMNE